MGNIRNMVEPRSVAIYSGIAEVEGTPRSHKPPGSWLTPAQESWYRHSCAGGVGVECFSRRVGHPFSNKILCRSGRKKGRQRREREGRGGRKEGRQRGGERGKREGETHAQ